MVSSINQISITEPTVNILACNNTGRLANLLISKFGPYQDIARSGNFTGCQTISFSKDLFTPGVIYWVYLRDAETDLTVEDPDIVSKNFTYTPPPPAGAGAGMAVAGMAVALIAALGIGYLLLKSGGEAGKSPPGGR